MDRGVGSRQAATSNRQTGEGTSAAKHAVRANPRLVSISAPPLESLAALVRESGEEKLGAIELGSPEARAEWQAWNRSRWDGLGPCGLSPIGQEILAENRDRLPPLGLDVLRLQTHLLIMRRTGRAAAISPVDLL